MNRNGFTLIEVIIVFLMTTILLGAIIFVYVGCLQAWSLADTRSELRNNISQSLEYMVRDIRQASSLGTTSATSVKFTANFGTGSTEYRFHTWPTADSSIYDLKRGLGSEPDGQGIVMLTGIQSGSIFSVSGQEVTADVTAAKYGTSIRMRTKVRLRN